MISNRVSSSMHLIMKLKFRDFLSLQSVFQFLFRPFNDDELRNKAPQVVTCDDPNREVSVTQSIAGKSIDRVFTFDKVRAISFLVSIFQYYPSYRLVNSLLVAYIFLF